MKEINFEFSIPPFIYTKKGRSKMKIMASITWLALMFLVGMLKFEFTLTGALILVYFGLSIIWQLDSRISAAPALFFLAGCPILLYFKNDALAETFAVYAYYFLVITVVGEVISLIMEKKSPKNLPVDNLS